MAIIVFVCLDVSLFVCPGLLSDSVDCTVTISHIVITLCTRIEKAIEFGDKLVNAKYVN